MSRIFSKNFARIALIIICLISLLGALNIVINYNYNDQNASYASNSFESYQNTQTYVTENGETHTIYWAKGVDAPKMPSKNEDIVSGERVFKKRVDIAGGVEYANYSFPVESGKGYYDLNKNPKMTNIYPQQVAHHCYLAAGLNQLYWWLEQNKYYVDKYVNYIAKDIFEQFPGLHPIEDVEMWKRYRQLPSVQYTALNDYYSMQLSDSILYKEVFDVYHDRDLGYFSDLVWDFFFNGYFHYHPKDDGTTAPPNSPDLWQADPKGGLFYDIFGREKISVRQGIGTYEMFNEVVKNAIISNTGIVLDFLSAGPAHAISLWGAEFNEEGNIVRVFLTDSDDFNETDVVENNHIKGLYSNDIVKDSLGNARLTTRTDRAKDKGSIIHELVLLSLAQDKLERALNDIEGPQTPQFELNLVNQAYIAKDELPRTLEVKIKKEERCDVFYQWYQANDSTSEGVLLKGETRPWIKPKIPQEDNVVTYYYCKVTNIKNGKKSVAFSNRSKVYVDSSITHALKPFVSYVSKQEVKYAQYDLPIALEIIAQPQDAGKLTYQWYKRDSELNMAPVNGVKIEGAIYPKYFPSTAQEGTATMYYCIVTNTNREVSGEQVVTASPSEGIDVIVLGKKPLLNAKEPVIELNIVDNLEFKIGDESKNLEVHASSIDGGDISYQWYRAKDFHAVGEKIEGATLSTYKPETNIASTFYYYCKLTNTNNKAQSKKATSIDSSRSMVVVKSGSTEISSNAYLKSLALSIGTLNPQFQKYVLNYTVKLNYNETSTTISGLVEDEGAKIYGLGKVELLNGESKVVEIKVVAEDGVTAKTYKITITRENVPKIPSSNNKLSNLSIDNVSLTPDFSDEIYEYSTTVANSVTSVKINVTLACNDASYVINGNINSLEVGVNTITIIVTAEDESTQDYVIKIVREEKNDIELEVPPVEENLDNEDNFSEKTLWIIIGIICGITITVGVIILIIKRRIK